MKVKGYSVEKIEDQGPLGMITEFESKLPLTEIDLDDFERRLKKLAEIDSKNLITKA